MSPIDSALWKCIASLWPKLRDNKFMGVGKDGNILFWDDKWLYEDTRLRDMVDMVPEDIHTWRLCEVNTNGLSEI